VSNIDSKSGGEIDVLIQRLEGNKARLAEKLAEVTKNLDALHTAKLLLAGGSTSKEAEPISTISSRELQGKTHLQALEYIAQHSENRLRISVAKALMANAGLFKGSPKNHYNILFTIITRSGRYKRVRPGEYELLPPEEDKTSPWTQVHRRLGAG
jgi:hypothetical protein